MTVTKLIQVEQRKEFFYLAENFLRPAEKYFCALMEKIQKNENTVFVLVQKEFPSCKIKILGVFSYTRGKHFSAYFPVYTKSAEDVLIKFFKTHEIFCLSGEKSNVEHIEKLYFRAKNLVPQEERAMFLMEYSDSENESKNHSKLKNAETSPTEFNQIADKKNFSEKNKNFPQIVECTFSDEEAIFPLHLEYCKAEVLPFWKNLNLAAERLCLEQNLKTQYVVGIFDDLHKNLLAKAQTNAESSSTVQIGGVFTQKSCRKKGYACALVNHIAQKFKSQKKNVVLFVRKNNLEALHSYENAGFKYLGDYKLDYYL